MAMTSTDYYKLGEDAGFTGALSEAPKEGSWQRAAWDRGFKAGTAGRNAKPGAGGAGETKTKLAEYLDARNAILFAKWPRAAYEHFRRLCNDIADEVNMKRQERLLRAIGRMTKRYGQVNREELAAFNEAADFTAESWKKLSPNTSTTNQPKA